MKQIFISFILLCLVTSCKNDAIEKTKQIEFKTYLEWWTYHNKYIRLYDDYAAKNIDNTTISKQKFLDLLSTGNYVPVVSKNETEIAYQLQLLGSEIGKTDIQNTIKQIATTEIYRLNWENKPFPEFEFKDINGNKYNKEFLQNKTVFLKTYFIKCQVCNEEMKDLNVFADKNQNKPFLCLALDGESDLKNFLQDKHSKYAYVAKQEKFIKDELKTNSFPTHFLIENGMVKKVFGRAVDLISYCEKNETMAK